MGKQLHRVDEIIDRHNCDKEELIQILLDLQDEFRWLSKPILDRTAQRLGVPQNHIYNLTTFYTHFSLVPKGRHSVQVCMGTACHVRGAKKLLDRVTAVVGVEAGETSADEKFSVDTVNCLGACALGPVMLADGEYLSNPSQDALRGKVDGCE